MKFSLYLQTRFQLEERCYTFTTAAPPTKYLQRIQREFNTEFRVSDKAEDTLV